MLPGGVEHCYYMFVHARDELRILKCYCCSDLNVYYVRH